MGDLSLSIASMSDKGRRPANEDSFLVLDAGQLGDGTDALLVVADGMGGRASGAVASELAVNAVKQHFPTRDPGLGPDEALHRCLQAANDAVYREAASKPELKGMGTTCVAMAVTRGKAYLAYLGDSRAYLLRDGSLRRLTEDHSLVAEKVKSGEMTEDQARRSRFRNIITRAVGLDATAHPDTGSVDVRSGDVLLLCTDGLSTPVPDDQIADILCTSSSPDEACDRLVKTALKNGGSDNITVVVAACGTPVATRTAPPEKRRPSRLMPLFLGLLIGLGGGAFVGREFLPSREPVKVAVTTSQAPDLSQVAYANPISLLYEPVQGTYIEMDGQGRLYVVDARGQVVRLDISGQAARTFPERDVLKPRRHKASPMLALDSQGNQYISEPDKGRILKYDSNGMLLSAIGEEQLLEPEALVVDKDGSIYVVDRERLKAIRAVQPVLTSPGEE